MGCQQGHGRFNSSDFKAHAFDFSLQVKGKKSKLVIDNLTGFSGKISLNAQDQSGKWQLRFKAQRLSLRYRSVSLIFSEGAGSFKRAEISDIFGVAWSS
jgi:hypothetical protein